MKNKSGKWKLLLALSFIPHTAILLFGLLCMFNGGGFLGSSLDPAESFLLGIVLFFSEYSVVIVPLLIVSLAIHIGLIIGKINSSRKKKISTKKLAITVAILATVMAALFVIRTVFRSETMAMERNIKANVLCLFADEKVTTKNKQWDNAGLFHNDDITCNTMMIDWDSNRVTMVREYSVESFTIKSIDMSEINAIKSRLEKDEEKTLMFDDGSVVTLYYDYSAISLITVTKPDGSVYGRELHPGHLPEYYLYEEDFD